MMSHQHPTVAIRFVRSKMSKIHPLKSGDEETDSPSEMECLFKPLMTVLNIGGMHTPIKRRRVSKVISILYSVVINVLLWFATLRFLFLFTEEIQTVGRLMTSLSYFGFHFSVTYLYTATCFSVYKHLPKLFREYDLYRNTHGSGLQNVQIRRYLTVVIVICAAEITIDQPCIYLASFHNVDHKALYLTPLRHISEGYHQLLKVLYVLLLLVNQIQLHFFLIFFIFITYCLFKEFSMVNARIAKLCDKGNEDIPSSSEFDRMRRQFEDTCSLVSKANEVFKHVIGSCYVASVPVICLMLYGLIHVSMNEGEYFMLPMAMVLLISMVVISTLTSVGLNMKAHSSLSHLLMCDCSRLSDRSLHIISIFITRLTTTKIGFTLYNLFTIDSSTILMLTGTMLTYVVVVLQFKPD